jgi:magnesium chelatase subunit D
MTTPYPFSAIVGLDDLELALLLNAVSPAIGGVLVRGEKGTAKSTIVRGLAALLPPVHVVTGCRFACDPAAPDPRCPDGPHAPEASTSSRPARLVELPVGASEDRLVGSLDLERALTSGVKAFEPGLLAAAHRGVLYVDEVNLLHDHLVDLLLDAAAMGTAYVEREGVSVRHAARFLLVGTMNPEEGELRPQLLDRFGLAVDVRASREPSERAEVVRRRLSYDADPDGFADRFSSLDTALARRIVAAQALLGQVVLSDAALRQVTAVCAAFEVDGMRGDLVTARTAIALAAWDGRTEVAGDDVRTAARLALPHRRRRDPFDSLGSNGIDDDTLEQAMAESGPDPDEPPDGPGNDGGSGGGGSGGDDGSGGEPEPADREDGEAGEASQSETNGRTPAAGSSERPAAAPQTPFRTKLLALPTIGEGGPSGRRGRTTGASNGRTTGSRRPAERLRRLHTTATLLAAAPHQQSRGRSGPGLVLARSDLREAVREGRESNLVLFCVDASGSMAARARMQVVKTAVLSLLLDAYQRRDKVGLITFRTGTNAPDAVVALPPTSSVERASARLAALPTGGRTPLHAGLLESARVLDTERLRDPLRRPLLVVVTDGRHTSGPDPVAAAGLIASRGIASIVVDCESGPVRLGMATRLGVALGGLTLPLHELAADGLAGVVRDVRRVA